VLSPDKVVINLTQAQVRGLVGISEEQFRSWRNAFAPLKARQGQSPQFGMGDVLAMAIVAELVESYGAKISKLVPIADQLFEVCTHLAGLNDHHATFLLISRNGVTTARTDAVSLIEASFVIPVTPLKSRIQQAVLTARGIDAQLSLAGL
jgi:hypothetical protein